MHRWQYVQIFPNKYESVRLKDESSENKLYMVSNVVILREIESSNALAIGYNVDFSKGSQYIWGMF